MRILYDLDSTRVSLREYRFGTPWVLVPLAIIQKVCRISLPGSTDDPPVESLTEFEVEVSALPEEIQGRVQGLIDRFVALDFGQPVYHVFHLPHLSTRIYWATFLHRHGQIIARIHYRIWNAQEGQRTYLFLQLLSVLEDGSFVVTSGGGPDMLTPESIRLYHHPGANAERLWQFHTGHLNEALPRSPQPIVNPDSLRSALEKHHAQVRDFNLERGVFKVVPHDIPLSIPHSSEMTQRTPDEAAILAEIEHLQTQNRGWGTAFVVLVVSLLLFIAATQAQFGLDFLWSLVPVLFFHEAGHYLAMRWFGYRNLRMFFIPFFGAAVSGRNYNVSGAKKTTVALMGPVPGICFGIILGAIGVGLARLWLVNLALMFVILNGLNLLPILPLDGGWVLHAVLFARHPVLDLVFRLLALGGLIALGLLSGSMILCYIAIPMLLALPVSFQVARIAHRLRCRDTIAVSPDSQTIPPEAALTILDALRAAFPSIVNPKTLALYVTNIFETLNARPPGLLGSLTLLMVHGGSFLLAVAAAVLFVLGLGGELKETLHLMVNRPAHKYEQGTTQFWRGHLVPPPSPHEPFTLIATYADAGIASIRFTALQAELPAQATMRLFGETLLVTFPADPAGELASRIWSDRLRGEGKHFVLDGPEVVAPARVYCLVPSVESGQEIVDDLEQYLQAPLVPTLIPPWSPDWLGLPAAQRDQFRLARRTYHRLWRLLAAVREKPEYQALHAQIKERVQGQDRGGVAQIAEQLHRLHQAEVARLVAALRDEDATQVDHMVLDLWERLQKPVLENPEPGGATAAGRADPIEGGQGRLRRRWKDEESRLANLARRMGQVPQVGGSTRTSIDGVLDGCVQRRGLYLAISDVAFVQSTAGLPALAEWLYGRQCVDVYYGFESTADDRPE